MGDDFGFGDGVSLEGVVVVFSAGVRRASAAPTFSDAAPVIGCCS